MGRRPVGTKKKERIEASPADGASESESNGRSLGAVAARDQDQVAPQAELPEAGIAAAATAAAAGSKREDEAEGTEQGDKNPLIGLVYYGSESEDEGTPAISRTGSSSSVSKVETAKSAGAFESEAAVSSGSPVPTVAADAHEGTVLELPSDWEKCMDNSGAAYYWNTESGETTWEMPAGAVYRRKEASAPASSSIPSGNDADGTLEEAAPVATGGDRVASDGTSDTASDIGEDENEEIKRSTDSASAISASNAAASENASRGLGGDEINCASGTKGISGKAENTPSGLEPEQLVDAGTSGVGNDAKPSKEDAAFSGVDDLLAGIEAEMMSGTVDGGGGTRRADAADTAADTTEDTKSIQEDFTLLKEIASGLDVRARQLHAELIECLARAEKEDGGEVGRQAAGMDVKRKLALELNAVLRARLSDWREGGLDGAFLVRKLEEMAVQARSSLFDSHGLAAATQSTQMDEEPSVASASPSGTSATETASAVSPNTLETVFVPDGMKDQKESPPSKAASTKNRKLNDKSKRGRRLGGGPIRSSSATGAKKEENGEGKVPGSGEDSGEGRAELGSSTAEADAIKAAEVLREAETVEKLRWADEVSAAATAAVAAAVRAKKKEAEAKERSTTDRELSPQSRQQRDDDDGHRDEMKSPEQDGSGEEGEIKVVVKAKAKTTSALVNDESSVIPKVSGEDHGEGDGDVRKPRTGTPPAESGGVSKGEGVSAVKSSLPSGWTAVWDNDYSAYYYHNIFTDETTWVLPTNEAATETPPSTPVEQAPRQTASSASSSLSNGVKASTDPLDREASEEAGEDRQKEGETSRSSKRRQSSAGREAVHGRAEASLGSMSAREGDKKARESEESSTGEEAASAVSATASAKDENLAGTEKAEGASNEGASLAAEGLPRLWAAVWDANHNAYYYHNTETDETSWERPIAPLHSDGGEGQGRAGVTPTNAREVDPTQGDKVEASSSAAASNAVDMRPSTLVWWSDAGDVWTGESLSGLLVGYGPRRYRNLGGGYYMLTLEMGAEWAAAAVAALGQGVADPVSAARVDWVCCTASTPGYGLFLRWAADDDEQNLFDVPSELFTDPSPEPAAAVAGDDSAAAHAASLAEAEAAREEAEANAAAVAAVAATEAAEAAGSETAAEVLAKAATPAPVPKKRKSSKGSGKGASSGSISKKRKGAASLIDKWKAVASTAGEEAEREAERQEKMERWKARAAALDPDNPNFMPLGRKRR